MKSAIAETFREEAQELLAELESALLELENAPNRRDIIGRVFRALHTLKGAGAMAGFEKVADLLHEVESVYELVRNGLLQADRELIGMTLCARDRVRSMVQNDEATDNGDARFLELKEAFQALLPPPLTHPEPNSGQLPGEAGDQAAIYRIRFKPPRDIFQRGIDPDGFLRELASLGACDIVTDTTAVPPLEALDPEHCYLRWEATLKTCEGENAIRDIFIFVEDGSELAIEQVGAGLAKDSTATSPRDLPGAAGSEPSFSSQHPVAHRSDSREEAGARPKGDRASHMESAHSIRVRSDKLDALVDLVGQLVTVQARLNQLADERDDADLIAVAEDVERLSWDLRDKVLNVRMLPIGGTFSKFRRLVRDLGTELGKEVELSTEGTETELDKTLIERLHEPLVHLIRNSIDHGIEPPESRRAAGKTVSGRVHLAASHSGSSVLIRVSDDGAGLDREAIRERATALGLIAPNAEMSDREIFALIFTSGLSTAGQVTSVSGRGIGMDAVRQTIESLRGAIEVASSPGQGTTLTIRLPLTLAIIDGLLVKIGETPFVVPLSAVEECIELHRENESRNGGRRLIDVRGEIVPYIRLRERFDMAGTPPAIEQIVIARPEGRRVGIVVDQVVGGHQTVIKPLGSLYRDLQDFSGATILGDGKVAMILDLPRIIQGAEECELKNIGPTPSACIR